MTCAMTCDTHRCLHLRRSKSRTCQEFLAETDCSRKPLQSQLLPGTLLLDAQASVDQEGVQHPQHPQDACEQCHARCNQDGGPS
jgi:hypothetical protein